MDRMTYEVLVWVLSGLFAVTSLLATLAMGTLIYMSSKKVIGELEVMCVKTSLALAPLKFARIPIEVIAMMWDSKGKDLKQLLVAYKEAAERRQHLVTTMFGNENVIVRRYVASRDDQLDFMANGFNGEADLLHLYAAN